MKGRARSWKATKQACREKETSNTSGRGGLRTNYGGRNKFGMTLGVGSEPSTEMTGTGEGAGMGVAW